MHLNINLATHPTKRRIRPEGYKMWFREYSRRYRESHKEECAARGKAWREANPEKHKEKALRWAKNNPERRSEINRKVRLKRDYGITPDEFNSLFEKQGSKCAICGTVSHGNRNWSIDHDHSTGQVRGILCNHCNSVLGHANDNTDTLRKCIAYLLKGGSPSLL